MQIFEAIALGLVQGLTEFLPVSSTGHLILIHDFLDAQFGSALAFDAVLHVATAGAVLVYFRKDVIELLHTLQRKLARLPVNNKEEVLLYALMIGTVPAIILGLFLENLMGTLFRNPILVAGILLTGSALFAVAEYVYSTTPRQPTITLKKGLIIGIFQALALFPGMSRSGATIVGGMLLGLERAQAARFAFLLAIPIILGAGSKKGLELLSGAETIQVIPLFVGAIVAFFTGLGAIHFMLSFVKKYTLWPFIWYRVVLATLVILFVYLT